MIAKSLPLLPHGRVGCGMIPVHLQQHVKLYFFLSTICHAYGTKYY